MRKIQILDCTLRDGGYINDFHFGERGIKKIIAQLSSANIDIIECGFLEDGNNDPEYSLYTTVDQIANILPSQRNENTMYVAMASLPLNSVFQQKLFPYLVIFCL